MPTIWSGGFGESVLSMTEQLSGRPLDKAIEALRPDRGVYRTRQIAIANAWHYSTEWYCAGPLLEEMDRETGRVYLETFHGIWSAACRMHEASSVLTEVEGRTPQEAIARAYLKWCQEKGAGG